MLNFFNKYPYTDFHELNLDWLMGEIQNINKKIRDIIRRIVKLEEKEKEKDKNTLIGYTALKPVDSLTTTDSFRYLSWPFSNLFYDEDSDGIYQVFNAGVDHVTLTSGGVYVNKISAIAPFTHKSAVKIASFDGSRATCHASLVTKDGNFVSFVREVNSTYNKLYLYMSVDKGASWNNLGELKDTDDNVICPDDGTIVSVHGAYRLADNTILIAVHDNTHGISSIYKGNTTCDNGSFYKCADISCPFGGDPYELCFAQNPKTGTITAISRRDDVPLTTDYVNPVGFMFTVSYDNGENWTPFNVTTIRDAQTNPCGIVEWKEDGYVEIFWGSRQKNNNYKGSLYQTKCTYEELEEGILGEPIKIGVGSPNGNFGYVAACRENDNVWVSYYNGGSKFSTINILRGQREGNANSIDNEIVCSRYDTENHWRYNIYQDGTFDYYQNIKIDLSDSSPQIFLPLISQYYRPYVSGEVADYGSISPACEISLNGGHGVSQLLETSKVTIEMTFGSRFRVLVGDATAHPSTTALDVCVNIRGILEL